MYLIQPTSASEGLSEPSPEGITNPEVDLIFTNWSSAGIIRIPLPLILVTSPDQPDPERTEATSTWKVDPFPTPSKLASTVKISPTVYPVPWSTRVNPVTVPLVTTRSAVAEAPVLGTRAVTVKPVPGIPVTPRTSPTVSYTHLTLPTKA